MSTIQQDTIETVETIQRFPNLALMFDEIAQEDVKYTVEIERSPSALFTWVRIRTISESGWVRSSAQWAIRRTSSGRVNCRFIGGSRVFLGKTTKYRNREEATRGLIHTARTNI